MAWRFLLLLALVAGSTAAADTSDKNLCQGCRKIVSLMERVNQTTGSENMATVLQHFCEQYYPPSTDYQQGPCPMFIQGLTYIISNTNPVTHCDEINVCGPTQPSDDIFKYIESSNLITPVSTLGDNVVCEYCESLVQQTKKALSDPATVRKVREQADAFCTYLQVLDLEKECKHMIDNYIDYFENLVRNVDVRAYCSSIHMCPMSSSRPASATKEQLPTLADFNNFGIETAVHIGPKPSDIGSSQQTSGTPDCTICKTLVKEMFHFLRENKTEENIIKGLDRVCHVIYPSEPKLGQCMSMVQAYTREIVQLLVDETDPEVICMLLEQCAYMKDPPKPQEITSKPETPTTAPPKEAYGLSSLITSLDPTIEVKSARSCVECKMLIKFLKERLQNSRSQDEIKNWLLDNLCKQLPDDSLVKSCSSIVEQYSEIVFQAIAGDLNPQAACFELGACSSKSLTQVLDLVHPPEAKTSPITTRPSGPRRLFTASKKARCAICQEAVSWLDDYLATQPASSDSAVSQVCESINSPYQADCRAIIGNFGADIIRFIPTMESPRHLCKQITVC